MKDKARVELETTVWEIGKVITRVLPAGVGFALILADFGADGNFAYTSSSEGFLKLLAEALEKLQAAPPAPPRGKA